MVISKNLKELAVFTQKNEQWIGDFLVNQLNFSQF
jgi:hypothetical protein